MRKFTKTSSKVWIIFEFGIFIFVVISFQVKSVLDARVLELDDELKEAHNKFDALKFEKVRKFSLSATL